MPVVGRKAQDPTFKGHQGSSTENPDVQKIFGGWGGPCASINHVSVFFCPGLTNVKWNSTNYDIKNINNEEKWNIHASAS